MNIRTLLLIITSVPMMVLARPPINLFRPSDRPLMPEPILPCWSSQFSIGYEGAFHTKGFQDDDDGASQACIHASTDLKKETNVLQVYQPRQDGMASFKGFDSHSRAGQLSQLFNKDDDNGLQGLYRPRGDLRIPLNLLLSQRFYFDYGFSLAFHLPVIHMELKDIHWHSLNNGITGEQILEKDLIAHARRIAGLNVHGWKRTGIGDLVAQATWMCDFPQAKPSLTNVRVQTRFGVDFPTGKKADEDLVLALPFGNDGAWGIQFAGGIDLTLCYTLRAGIDAEFLYLFGNTRCRRVKTTREQTDFFFLRKAPVFRDVGLGQQFNMYVESCNFWRGLSAKINYQFLKQNEGRFDIGSDSIDPSIVNSAENLQDWTAHSLIFSARYDLYKEIPDATVLPSILGWIKWGFNGKRAILANTVGVQVSIAF